MQTSFIDQENRLAQLEKRASLAVPGKYCRPEFLLRDQSVQSAA